MITIRPVKAESDITSLRERIDAVDQQILALVAERVRIVLAVGDYKRARGLPVYDPVREREMLERLCSLAPEPLDHATVRGVFERLIDESRRLENDHMKG
ncbi:MAG: chorismate mutase [Polyangiaceae bacterium]|nr:chorismate mutase [Polyangiaceae bacterium]